MDKSQYFKELSKLFGVEFNEPFKMDYQNNRFRHNIHIFNEKGLQVLKDGKFISSNSTIADFTADKVIRLPKKPEKNETYFYPDYVCGYLESIWTDTKYDNMILEKVGCYKTQQEALKKAKELWK